MAFWGNREKAASAKKEAGKIDQGTRGAVTSGGNMDGFLVLVQAIVEDNGLKDAEIHVRKGLTVLPGFFRPTKMWDVVVLHRGRLVATVELKSQVGSLGNNYNNRTEEAIGSAKDFWTAYREGAFGECPKPFLGWLMLLEDSPKATKTVRNAAPNFPVDAAFNETGYAGRYDVLCHRLIEEQLYTSASLVLTPKTAKQDGSYRDISDLTGVENFCITLAGHIAAESARKR